MTSSRLESWPPGPLPWPTPGPMAGFCLRPRPAASTRPVSHQYQHRPPNPAPATSHPRRSGRVGLTRRLPTRSGRHSAIASTDPPKPAQATFLPSAPIPPDRPRQARDVAPQNPPRPARGPCPTTTLAPPPPGCRGGFWRIEASGRLDSLLRRHDRAAWWPGGQTGSTTRWPQAANELGSILQSVRCQWVWVSPSSFYT